MSNRFVILHHQTAAGEHWDLMLEQTDCLLTWRLPRDPADRSEFPIDAERIRDHRKRYLDFEGPLSGGRGDVSRVDEGTYKLVAADADGLTIELEGKRLAGRFGLRRDDSAGDDRWSFEALPAG